MRPSITCTPISWLRLWRSCTDFRLHNRPHTRHTVQCTRRKGNYLICDEFRLLAVPQAPGFPPLKSPSSSFPHKRKAPTTPCCTCGSNAIGPYKTFWTVTSYTDSCRMYIHVKYVVKASLHAKYYIANISSQFTQKQLALVLFTTNQTRTYFFKYTWETNLPILWIKLQTKALWDLHTTTEPVLGSSKG